ncbi:MAG: hypothetical protein ACI89G_002836 [Minisyncoccia bacterium]|jgi:hypothetical protein
MGDLEAVSGLLRLRVVLVTAMMAVLAVVAGNIFDRQVWWLLMAVALPALVSIVVSNFASVVRFISALLSIGTSVTIIVFAVGGQASDVVDALTAGTQRLLSTDWPSPERPDLIGTVGLVLAVPTAVAADLAGRRDWHLLALTPIVASGVLVTALCAPSGAQMVWLIPVGLLAAIFATLRPMIGDDREIGAQRVWLRGERRLIPVVLLAGLVAAAVSVPTVLADRADPRRNEPAKQTAPLLDPIEATLALRALDPPADLYQLTTESGINLPDRWRTAALNDYDGQRWTPALTLRPIGRRLTPDTSGMFMFDLELLDDGLALVPFPSTPITINVPVETDSDRTVVRLTERIDPGDTIAVSSGPIITTADALATGIATRVIDDSVSSLTEFAETLAGDGTVLDQLRQIQSTMRDDWVLASNAPGAGLQRALLERFIRDTKRGTAEQFAAAYVLLARSLGVDARVATGFVGARSATGSALTLVSSDAAVWPEVGLLDGRWIAFDPVPPDEASDVAPPDEPAVQTPAAAQPPIAPAPELTPDTADDEVGNDASSTTASVYVRWGQKAGIALGTILVALAALAAIILLAKFQRRRKRLASGTPAQRITGAWAVATDRLVDAGLTIAPSAANGDIATSGALLVANAQRELIQLATLSSAVTFGNPAETDFLVTDAVAHLDQVETSMAEVRTRGEQLRWRLSLRSLRPGTRSPVR